MAVSVPTERAPASPGGMYLSSRRQQGMRESLLSSQAVQCAVGKGHGGMTPVEFLHAILDPGLAWCKALPGWNVSFDDRALVMSLAIPGQESRYTDRVQGGNGPAHGFSQFERGGGVVGVLTHPASAKLASVACAACGIPADPAHAWGLMATAKGDNLGVAFTRLLLLTDPRSLPVLGDKQAAWNYYVRNWRPGAVAAGGERAIKARERWSEVYPETLATIETKGTPG